MNKIITITRKGQTTLPASIRRKLGIGANGGTLELRFDEKKGEVTISKPVSISELSNKITSYLKPGIEPLTDVDTFYQQQRKVT